MRKTMESLLESGFGSINLDQGGGELVILTLPLPSGTDCHPSSLIILKVGGIGATDAI